MASVGIKKRGKVYQYQFEIAPVKGQRKWITKSGFKTKAEAQEEGNKAYTEYLNAGMPFKDCNISYTDYLDYWLNNYCKINLKYNTIQAYKNIIKNHIVPKLGKYRLSTITSVKLNSYITEICEENDFAPTYFKNILKVVKGSFRDACNVYGFIKYNPARDLRLPRFDKKREDVKHLYTQKEIADKLKISQSYVSRLITKIVKRIGIQLQKNGVIETVGRTGKQTKKIKSNKLLLQPSSITPTMDIQHQEKIEPVNQNKVAIEESSIGVEEMNFEKKRGKKLQTIYEYLKGYTLATKSVKIKKD